MATNKTSTRPGGRMTEERLMQLVRSTGWIPDPPSIKDLTAKHADIQKLLRPTGLIVRKLRKRLRKTVDLRPYCSPVQFQGQYNTCTAHVVSSMLAVQENRAHGRYILASRLFLYQVTKRIIGSDTADPGVYLRQMMGCLVLIGVPPETYFPYLDTQTDKDPRIDAKPDAFCYAMAADQRAIRYVRLDPMGEDPPEVLDRIRGFLSAGFSTSIGFPLFMSALKASGDTGDIALPVPDEDAVGSHAVLLVGFDDERVVAGSGSGPSATGAFLFKNSWDTTWGDDGYGWLPYQYLLGGMSHDVWTLIQSRWVDTDQFQIGWEESPPTS